MTSGVHRILTRTFVAELVRLTKDRSAGERACIAGEVLTETFEALVPNPDHCVGSVAALVAYFAHRAGMSVSDVHFLIGAAWPRAQRVAEQRAADEAIARATKTDA
jgi:hypothetical protein